MPTINLTYGVYRVPRFKLGTSIRCDYRKQLVTIADIAENGWPLYRPTPAGGKLLPVLCDGLVDAVRQEAAKSIAAQWQVSRYTVRRWRKSLGVPRMNEGTRKLWRQMAKAKLTPAVRRKGTRNSAKVRRSRCL